MYSCFHSHIFLFCYYFLTSLFFISFFLKTEKWSEVKSIGKNIIWTKRGSDSCVQGVQCPTKVAEEDGWWYGTEWDNNELSGRQVWWTRKETRKNSAIRKNYSWKQAPWKNRFTQRQIVWEYWRMTYIKFAGLIIQ